MVVSKLLLSNVSRSSLITLITAVSKLFLVWCGGGVGSDKLSFSHNLSACQISI